jgi:hypothetical protein
MAVTPELTETLCLIAEAAAATRADWWIIGSAAVVLHGASLPDVEDVDLLMSALDAESFLRHVGEVPRPGAPSHRFRSMVFGIWTQPPIPVEVMGGFSFAIQRGWHEVALATREKIAVGGTSVFVPSADELVTLLQSFGRQKDLDRAKLLRP